MFAKSINVLIIVANLLFLILYVKIFSDILFVQILFCFTALLHLSYIVIYEMVTDSFFERYGLRLHISKNHLTFIWKSWIYLRLLINLHKFVWYENYFAFRF